MDRILIVDDDLSIRLLIAACLRPRGFDLLQAQNGREALAQMRIGSADLVIMDLWMPDVSGWDVVRERLADPQLLQTPMIVMTANNTPAVTAELLEQRVTAVIGKPFDLDVLLAAVTNCLAGPNVPELVAA